MRGPLTGWMILCAVLALSAGALAGSGGARASRLDELTLESEAALRERDALIASLTADLARLRDEADTARMGTEAAGAALRTAQRLLAESSDQLRLAEESHNLQQQDQRVLQACLTGALYALQTMAEGNSYGAMYYMVNVDGECKAAYRLLNVQPQPSN
ncbi:MAG: hypothetical protein ACRDF6_02775 [bacterium]